MGTIRPDLAPVGVHLRPYCDPACNSAWQPSEQRFVSLLLGKRIAAERLGDDGGEGLEGFAGLDGFDGEPDATSESEGQHNINHRGEEPGEEGGFGGEGEFEDEARGERDLGDRLRDDADRHEGSGLGSRGRGLRGSSGAEEVASPDVELFFGEGVEAAELADGESGLVVVGEAFAPELGFGFIAS